MQRGEVRPRPGIPSPRCRLALRLARKTRSLLRRDILVGPDVEPRPLGDGRAPEIAAAVAFCRGPVDVEAGIDERGPGPKPERTGIGPDPDRSARRPSP